MNIADLRIPCEPPCTEPYARWCGSRGRATAPSYPMSCCHSGRGESCIRPALGLKEGDHEDRPYYLALTRVSASGACSGASS